ncbi:hypothetical protein Pla22_36480 [Rubripirellula amarantea]|uniref:Uncharacterized protein n=1 Tax=Rubripirellula amarantea TaxID=2527999 RepID=A0A5C5WL67_9BACT|nr:hypothetical protein [Rubripirellula amarantea]TWT50905.1 hypothetical protein Pla22_36480 [Rubripirellula amarantea]
MPGFYAWTDSDQSRPSPLLWKVPLWVAIASVAFCAALPWLPVNASTVGASSRQAIRFSLRSLLAVTAGVAIAIALIAVFPIVFSGLTCAAAYVYLIAFCLRNRQHRTAGFALIACMIFPYGWVVSYEELDRILPTLAILLAGMPTFVPAALIGQLFGQHFQDSQWVAYLLTAAEIFVGIWMMRLGPKRTIAYLLFVMQISALSSLAFYMMCIA